MKILLLRTWITNIGNGFIDKGARASLRRAFPDSKIIEASGYPNKVAERKDSGRIPDKISKMFPDARIRKQSQGQSYLKRSVNVSEFIDVDLAVLPGCILYDNVLSLYYDTLKSLKDRDIPIMLLGAGGGDYEASTSNYTNKILNNLSPIGLITRDSEAYKHYQNSVEHAYNGIDCAFFINDWYNPPDSNSEFDIYTFDKTDEPEALTTTDRRIIRADHYPFEQPHANLYKKFELLRRQQKFYDSNNIFVSDILEDYLFFYSNANITHSDRIHACVPTLSYGNKAKFWFDTPRDALFGNVNPMITDSGVMELNENKIEELKSDQVKYIKEIVKNSDV